MNELYYLYCLSSTPITLPARFIQKKVGELFVIHSLVSPQIFGQEALDKQIKDIEWVTTQAQAHSEIIQQCHAQASIIPMRFPTLFTTWEGVQASVIPYESIYTDFLAKINGKSEWTVRFYAHESHLATHLEHNTPELLQLKTAIEQASAGKAFILKKQYEQALHIHIDAFIQQKMHAFLQSLQPIEGKQIALNYAQEDQETHKIIGKYVFLVHNTEQEAFINNLQQFQTAHTSEGLSLQYSGGWAIYHFLPIENKGS